MTLPERLSLRFAREDDIPLVLRFIRELADYEHMLDEVVATEELLREWMFERRTVEALLAELDGEPVGFALFFHNFSTFLGRGGIYLAGRGQGPAPGPGRVGRGTRLRPPGMVLPGLERTRHRLLPEHGRGSHG